MVGTKHYDVVSIGTLTYDISQPISDRGLKQLNLPKGHSTLVSASTFKKLAKSSKIKHKSAGGVGSNITIGLALNGAKTAMIGRIGADNLGKDFIKSFKKHGVDFTANPHPDKPTTALMSYVTPDGERSFAVMPGATSEVGPDDIDENLIKNSKITHIDTFLLQSPTGIEGMKYAAHIARQNDSIVAIGLNDENLMRKHKSTMRKMLENDADIIIGSMDQFMAIFDTKDINETLMLAKTLNAKIALTQGAKDVYTIEDGTVSRVRVVPSERVVDTCGAGDQFAAGVMKGIADGYTVKDSARQGVRWAKHIIEKLGGIPTKKQAKIKLLDGPPPKKPKPRPRMSFAA